MVEGGPYRKPATTPDQHRLQEMEREIKKADKFSIFLPENIREGDLLPLFKTLVETKSDLKVNAEDIILYSLTTGILRYTETKHIAEGINYYHYTGGEKPIIELVISLNTNLDQAAIISLSAQDTTDTIQI